MSKKSEKSEKREGLGWFYGRWCKIFEELDKSAIYQFVSDLKDKYPEEDEYQLAKRVVRRTARQTAVVGVAIATPALFPGLGTAVALATILPEEIFLVRRKCSMVLQIAALYGLDLQDDDRLLEIITLAGTPSRKIETLMTAKEDLRLIAAKATGILTSQTGRTAQVGMKAASRRFLRKLPALGFLVGGGLNFFSLRALGSKAIDYYQELRLQGRLLPCD